MVFLFTYNVCMGVYLIFVSTWCVIIQCSHSLFVRVSGSWSTFSFSFSGSDSESRSEGIAAGGWKRMSYPHKLHEVSVNLRISLARNISLNRFIFVWSLCSSSVCIFSFKCYSFHTLGTRIRCHQEYIIREERVSNVGILCIRCMWRVTWLPRGGTTCRSN